MTEPLPFTVDLIRGKGMYDDTWESRDFESEEEAEHYYAELCSMDPKDYGPLVVRFLKLNDGGRMYTVVKTHNIPRQRRVDR